MKILIKGRVGLLFVELEGICIKCDKELLLIKYWILLWIEFLFVKEYLKIVDLLKFFFIFFLKLEDKRK